MISICEIAERDISLMVSLSYHGGGIKVGQIASWTGLGWSLNAGGVVTRTVLGLPDEKPIAGFIHNTESSSEFLNYSPAQRHEYLQSIADHHIDVQPDEFFFNFAGYAGRLLDEILSKGGGGGGDLRYCPGIYTTFKSNEATLSDSTNAKTLFDFSKIPYPVGNMADFCKRMRKEYQAQVYFDLLNVILTPQLNKLSILNMIKFLPVSEIAKAVNLIEERNIEKIASSPEGLEVLNALQSKLPKGHERDMVDMALDARSNSPTSIPKSKASPSDISALDRINRVVRNDPHFSAYTGGCSRCPTF